MYTQLFDGYSCQCMHDPTIQGDRTSCEGKGSSQSESSGDSSIIKILDVLSLISCKQI